MQLSISLPTRFLSIDLLVSIFVGDPLLETLDLRGCLHGQVEVDIPVCRKIKNENE